MADIIDSIIKIRRGPDSQRRSTVLQSGEIAFSTDIGRVFVGDGFLSGGLYVGNNNYFGTEPNSYAIINDLYYNTTYNTVYMLTSNAGPDNIQNYARITPISDGTTILYNNGVFSLNQTYFNSQSTGFLKISGGTMAGFIKLHLNPTDPYHASTKGYADSIVETTSSFLNRRLDEEFVHISGDRLIGYLTLHSNPISSYHATTKGYTDTLVKGISTNLASKTSNNYVHLSGDQLTGYITLHTHPANTFHAATKGYTDTLVKTTSTILNNNQTSYVAKSGDTMSGFLTLNAINPINPLHATPKTYVDNQITTLNNNITNSLGVYLKKSGETMTGSLILKGLPSQPLEAAPKSYVDTLETNSNAKYIPKPIISSDGQILKYENSSNTWVPGNLSASLVDTKVSSYTSSTTLAFSDSNSIILANSSSSISILCPADSTGHKIGTQIVVIQEGTAQVQFAPINASVTLVSNSSRRKTISQWSSAVLIKIGPNKWYLGGDITV